MTDAGGVGGARRPSSAELLVACLAADLGDAVQDQPERPQLILHAFAVGAA